MLTPLEAAIILNVKPSTLTKWRQAGTGPEPVRLGYRTIRYRPSALVAYIAAGEKRDG